MPGFQKSTAANQGASGMGTWLTITRAMVESWCTAATNRTLWLAAGSEDAPPWRNGQEHRPYAVSNYGNGNTRNMSLFSGCRYSNFHGNLKRNGVAFQNAQPSCILCERERRQLVECVFFFCARTNFHEVESFRNRIGIDVVSVVCSKVPRYAQDSRVDVFPQGCFARIPGRLKMQWRWGPLKLYIARVTKWPTGVPVH